MVDKTKATKFDKLYEQLSKSMNPVFTDTQLRNAYKDLVGDKVVGDYLRKKLLNSAKELEIIWEDKSHTNLYSFDKKNVEVEHMLSAWTSYRNQYVSHYSALYLYDLVLQRPHDFHITREALANTGLVKNILNPTAVKQAFMKPFRKTKQKGYYKGNTFSFHEKKKSELCGITEIELRGVKIKISDLERTFLDCIMAPELAGGILTIENAFREVELNLIKVINHYRLINPIYPYWQRMGFMLDMINRDQSHLITKFFGSPQVDFFIDNNYREGWNYNEKWRIFYPQGLNK